MAVKIVPASLNTQAGFDAQQKQIDLNRRYAEAMAKTAVVPQGEMVGQHYVSPGWAGVFGEIGKGLIGAHARSSVDDAEKDLATKREKFSSDWFDKTLKAFNEGKDVNPEFPTPDNEAMTPTNRQLTPEEKLMMIGPGLGNHPLAPVLAQAALQEMGDIHKDKRDEKKLQAAAEAAAKKADWVFGEVNDENHRPIKALVDKNHPGTYVPVGTAKLEEMPEKIRTAEFLNKKYGMPMQQALSAAFDTTKVVAGPEGVQPMDTGYFKPGTTAAAITNGVPQQPATGGAPVAPSTVSVPPATAPMLPAGAAPAVAPQPVPSGMVPKPIDFAAATAATRAAQPAREAGRVATLTNEYNDELKRPPSPERDRNLFNIGLELKGMKAPIPGGADPAAAQQTPPGAPAAAPATKEAEVPLYKQKRPSDDPRSLTGEYAWKEGAPANTIGLGKLQNSTRELATKLEAAKIPALDAAMKEIEPIFAGKGDVAGFGRIVSQIPPGLVSEDGRINRQKFEGFKSEILHASAGLSQTESELKNVLNRLGTAFGQGVPEIRAAMRQLRDVLEARRGNIRAGADDTTLREYDIREAQQKEASRRERELTAGGANITTKPTAAQADALREYYMKQK